MAYCYVSKKSKKSYYLHSRKQKLKGGQVVELFYFTGIVGEGSLDNLPEGYYVEENPKTGLPMLKKGEWPDIEKRVKDIYGDKQINAVDFLLKERDDFITKDSGKKESFHTGYQRDCREGKGRYDLIPQYPLERLAKHYERGAAKYGDSNWRLGSPLMRFMDSALRHLHKAAAGMEDEDHCSAVLWNVMGFMETKRMIELGKLPKELDDYSKQKEFLDEKEI